MCAGAGMDHRSSCLLATARTAPSPSSTGSIDPDIGIKAVALGANSPISIFNSGAIFADVTAIYALGMTATTIVNTGSIGALSDRAIDTVGASTTIVNRSGGVITGFVDLTDNPDLFLNQKGGVFETKLVSEFGGGNDLFQNQAGGTVQAATNGNAAETSSFVNLERFDNAGLISLVDGGAGDVFRISNMAPPAGSLSSIAGSLSMRPAIRRWAWMPSSAGLALRQIISSSMAT